MSKTRCEAHNSLLSFMVVAIFFSTFLPPIELIVMYIMAFISIVAHIYYGACVVSFNYIILSRKMYFNYDHPVYLGLYNFIIYLFAVSGKTNG